jgi:plastocyanin
MTSDRNVKATFQMDLTAAPTTTITPDPPNPDGPGGSYVGSVHLSVSATDDSAVAETRCVLDPPSAPATFGDIPPGCDYLDPGADVASVGDHVLYAASVDDQGNQETPVSFAFEVVDAPSAPTSLTIEGRAGRALVDWAPPDADGGRNVTSYTVSASPGGPTLTIAAPTTAATLTGLTNCTKYTITVTATNAVGPGDAASGTVLPSSLVVRDSGYSRKLVTVQPGQTVSWCFDPANTKSHSVTSNTGLFDSGTAAPGDLFDEPFTAAGRYPYHSSVGGDSMTGTVSVKVIAVTSGDGALITWASAPPGAGSSMDVEVKQPGTSKWIYWKKQTTATSDTFSPENTPTLFTVPGTYAFKARFRSGGALSSWSGPTQASIG